MPRKDPLIDFYNKQYNAQTYIKNTVCIESVLVWFGLLIYFIMFFPFVLFKMMKKSRQNEIVNTELQIGSLYDLFKIIKKVFIQLWRCLQFIDLHIPCLYHILFILCVLIFIYLLGWFLILMENWGYIDDCETWAKKKMLSDPKWTRYVCPKV